MSKAYSKIARGLQEAIDGKVARIWTPADIEAAQAARSAAAQAQPGGGSWCAQREIDNGY